MMVNEAIIGSLILPDLARQSAPIIVRLNILP